jgi:hypothetical protein
MPQNLLLTPKAVSACATPAQCLMRCGYLGFRFVRYQCSPWFVLAIAPLKVLLASEVEWTYVQIRYLSLSVFMGCFLTCSGRSF